MVYFANPSTGAVSNVSIKAADAAKGSKKCKQNRVICRPMGKPCIFGSRIIHSDTTKSVVCFGLVLSLTVEQNLTFQGMRYQNALS